MIFADVLAMSVSKYLRYVDRFIAATSTTSFYRAYRIDEAILTQRPKGITAVVLGEQNEFRYYAPEHVKLNFELLREPDELKWKHSMNWIRSKNLFLHHLMTNLLALQIKFWQTQDRKTLVPVSLKEFLRAYPFPYLDMSRLSRLLNNNWISFKGVEYLLRDLFWTRKRVHARIVEHVMWRQPHRPKDRDIQALLQRDYGIDVSLRTICNYRNSLGIPAYNCDHLSNRYTNCFSTALPLHRESLPLIPRTAGVYEISSKTDIKYPRLRSRVIYFGRSNNLRARVQSYLCPGIKNDVIREYREREELCMRYFASPLYVEVEGELLRDFGDKTGSLPAANTLPKSRQ